jgi:hypothetical protein
MTFKYVKTTAKERKEEAKKNIKYIKFTGYSNRSIEDRIAKKTARCPKIVETSSGKKLHVTKGWRRSNVR